MPQTASIRRFIALLIILLPAAVRAADYRWTGATDTSWSVAGNWDPSGPPGAGDTAVIDTNVANQPVIGAAVSVYSIYVATSGVYGSTLTANYPITASSMVVVGAKGVITHTANTTTELYKSSITAGEMWVYGMININGKGYASGQGPGYASTCGGSYGGQEGCGNGATYGSYGGPVNIGSGGSSSGGGAVTLNIANTFTLSGSISANGNGGSGNYADGGSGGGVSITAGSLAGGGSITVNGGYDNGSGSAYNGADGGGGRIVVIASTASWSGSMQAFGGSSGFLAAAGTVFIKTPGTNGTLIVDNNNIASSLYAHFGSSTLAVDTSSIDKIIFRRKGNLELVNYSTMTISAPLDADGTGSFLKMSGRLNTPATFAISSYTLVLSSTSLVPSAAWLDIGYAGTVEFVGNTQAPWPVLSTLTIRNNGTLTHSANSNAETHKLNLTLSSMTIDAGGAININGKGYAGGQGPGYASTCGGSYGGQEGCGNGATYGSHDGPVSLGSGGSASGGGAVTLNIANTFTLNGNISANGNGGSGNYADGGSGGGVSITAGSLAGGGSITVNGGYDNGSGSAYNGADGGGGRIVVIASTASWSGSMQAFGGSSGFLAAAGTVFIKTPGTNGTLIVDNNNIASSLYAHFGSSTFALDTGSLDKITLKRKGNLELVNYSTMTITAPLDADGTGSILRMNGRLNTPAEFVVSSYTLVLSSTSLVPSATLLDIGYAGAVEFVGNTQAPWPVLSTVTIRNNGTLTHTANSTAETHKLNLTLSSMTIETGGKIDVTGKGYAGGQGPGFASTCGGSYGGQEGCGNGATYGSYGGPVNIGSGGSSSGGGAVTLNIANTFTLSGSIYANGNGGSGNYADGASGGGVSITAGSLAGGGSITVNGGYDNGSGSAYNGADGGGGRIVVIASTASWSGSMQAFGGSSGMQAAAGTVFIKTPGTNGTLIVDNNNIATLRYTGILAADSTLDSVQAVKKSSGTFLSFSTVTIKGENAFFDGDNTSTVSVSGNVYGGSFPEVWLSSFSVKWGAAGNPTNAQFTAEVSTHADYSVIENSSVTYNRNAFLLDVLEPNTTYYARVKAAGYTTLRTNYVLIGSTATYAAKPGTPANPFTGVLANSIDVSWLANGNPPNTEYQVQASTASNFTGTLFGPYAGPSGWSVGVTTTVISLSPCTTYYFQVKARNMNGIETGFQALGSTTTASYFDCGLKYWDGTQVITAACMYTGGACTGTSRLNIIKFGTIYKIGLVDPADSNASKMNIQTPEGVKAIRKNP